ncbi:hypothetical protein [Stakelama saccharophila]|uniref:Uncharacterized protein n=1 Tax=Stakelama saccharophila TaxID=3075605 RepID=A0ABZ0BC50_9SPHN|nr:hypothetical protein [Stakelama sp. W311]WNO55011.1 hypothetical protein RPR59_07145 [Stakelama sp. W311]
MTMGTAHKMLWLLSPLLLVFGLVELVLIEPLAIGLLSISTGSALIAVAVATNKKRSNG